MASIHRVGVRIASFSVHAGSSGGGAPAASVASGSESPSGRKPRSSGRSTIRKVTGIRAIIQTSAPNTIQASCQPRPAMTAEAIRGKAIRPME